MKFILDFICRKIVLWQLSLAVPLIYTVLLLVGASVPSAGYSMENEEHFLSFILLPPLLQNLLHIPAYGLLAFFWRWSLDSYLKDGQAIVLALMLTMSSGLLQEIHQSIIPGRFASLNDIGFNMIGAVAAIWLFHRIKVRGLSLLRSHPA